MGFRGMDIEETTAFLNECVNVSLTEIDQSFIDEPWGLTGKGDNVRLTNGKCSVDIRYGIENATGCGAWKEAEAQVKFEVPDDFKSFCSVSSHLGELYKDYDMQGKLPKPITKEQAAKWGKSWDDRENALAAKCPKCDAHVFNNCVTGSGKQSSTFHAARIKLGECVRTAVKKRGKQRMVTCTSNDCNEGITGYVEMMCPVIGEMTDFPESCFWCSGLGLVCEVCKMGPYHCKLDCDGWS